MGLTEKDVDHLSSLAKLRLSPESRAGILDDLKGIIQYVRRLEEIDTDDVNPMGHPFPGGEVAAREDHCEDGLSREEAMREAPDSLRGHFRVPKVL